jgi:hypothetical protein
MLAGNPNPASALLPVVNVRRLAGLLGLLLVVIVNVLVLSGGVRAT